MVDARANLPILERSKPAWRGRVGAAVAATAAILLVAAIGSRRTGGLPPSLSLSASGPPVVAEVWNRSKRPGLARLVTGVLRERGVDVVFFGSGAEPVDSTTVLVRRGDVARGHDVARAIGQARVVVAIDTLLRVDVTVLIGRDYRLPKGRFPL